MDACFSRVRVSDPAIKRVLLREEPLIAAVHSSHPLSTRKSISLNNLKDEQIFVYPPSEGQSYADTALNLYF